jgi:hypothetical protein
MPTKPTTTPTPPSVMATKVFASTTTQWTAKVKIKKNLFASQKLTVLHRSGKIKTSAKIVTVKTRALKLAWTATEKILLTKYVMTVKMLISVTRSAKVAQ